MNQVLVSIVTPVYNAERFLKETIISIREQSYKNWELLLIDDCSNDNSSKIIKEFQKIDSRIRYIKLEKNSGASVSRNIGIKNAKGRFIAFADSDDLWEPKKLEIQINYMLKHKYGFTFTSYRYMKENGVKTNKVAKAPFKINYNGLLKDTAAWLQILRKEKYAYGIQMDLVNYRLVGNSLSSNKIKALKRTWNTYRNVERLNIFKCSYVFCFYIYNAIKKRI